MSKKTKYKTKQRIEAAYAFKKRQKHRELNRPTDSVIVSKKKQKIVITDAKKQMSDSFDR